MNNFISNAISIGYTANQILNFISKKVKGLTKGIESSRNNGYKDEDILKFLSNKLSSSSGDKKSLNEMEKYQKSLGIKTGKERAEQFKSGIKSAFGLAGTALSAYNLYSMGKGVGLPQNPSELIDAEAEIIGSNPVNQMKETLAFPGKQQKQLPFNEQMPVEPEGSVIPQGYEKPSKLSDYIFEGVRVEELPVSKREKLKFIGQAASKLEQQGKTPESPEAEKLKQRVQEILKSKEGVVDEEINRFKGANPEAEITGQEATQMMNQSEDEKLSLSEFARKYKLTLSEANKIRNKQEAETMLQAPEQKQLTEEVIEQPEKPKPMGKGSTVLTKDGELATIEDFPGNTAKISVDGKKKVVKSDDLIELPLPEKDLADLYEDVISGIEKKTGQEVSRNVYLAGYDPNHNELFYKPHDGALYVYDDIPSWAVEELTNLLTKRKTTGSNYIGAWTAGTESPIGAAMSALIRKLQGERGGKGSEYSRKYDIIYDALEPAKQAAREKKKQKEKEEREKQRKEKAKKPRSR